jgi:alpha-galactosidase
VLDEGASRHAGLVHSLQLAWSGDSRIAIERDDEGFWVLSAGAVPAAGEIVLQPGESWSAPQAILAVSAHGTNGTMAQQHAAMRQRIGWPGGTMAPRPVHANSWEACYFDHDEERIVALAQACAAVGVERFVLDDGWFKGRNDDRAGLGDWNADPIKYPRGLRPLADRIVGMGMQFGLWVEPEMINPDSDIYRAHPDWALALAERNRLTARNQLVLDMRRAEVRDHLFKALDALLRDLPISYLKWDHNRDLAPAGSAAQVRGTYELFARLRAAHPLVEIESCAGGGGRSDAGTLAFTHRFGASDILDAVSRTAIQRGFLTFLPPEVMGSHIGASPAHATGRGQSLAFRAAVAMPGHFGIELDPRSLGDEDRADLAQWIAFHKQWCGLLHQGQVWLGEGADGLVWQAQGRADEFLLFAIRTAPALDRRPQPLRLPFLGHAGRCEAMLLRIASGRQQHAIPLPELWQQGAASFSGSWLAHAGLPMPPLGAETAAIFHVKVGA